MNGCAAGLALMERLKATRKWVIEMNIGGMPCNKLPSNGRKTQNNILPSSRNIKEVG